MALTEADLRRIGDLVRSQVDDLRQELAAGASSAGTASKPDADAAAAKAMAPFASTVGSWHLASTRTQGREFAAVEAPVDLDTFENRMYAGGRVLATNFSGRFASGVEGIAGAEATSGTRFGGYLALVYDAANNRYVQLYADDLGKVAYNSTDRWETDGPTLRLYFDDKNPDQTSGGFVAEFVSDNHGQLTYNLYAADDGTPGSAASKGELIKSTTMKRQ